ncbi:MAG: hypothetical protein F4Z77_03000 [Dehalococcoidia bacterium]|nr:hypothetical protein [Dehalococcoidia bacterium]MYA54148.1 hypothetical protein [Dehalococcoidia bacterium]MYD64757.1 hypothetical protein [Chloroflexota bacterium]
MTLLATYFERVQRRLHAEGAAAASFHHGLNRGQIREAFVREFLSQNISSLWEIGTGEIIHKDAAPGEARPQIDVVIHNRKYPKLSLATGIDLFFIESVSSFIEIKSRLTKEHVRQAAQATKTTKITATFPPQGLNPAGLVDTPRPFSFVFAYDGPRTIDTLVRWLWEVANEDDFRLHELTETEPDKRSFFPHLFIDGVFVLGVGFVFLDALPWRSHVDIAIEEGVNVRQSAIWISGEEHELLVLWAAINAVNERLLWNVGRLDDYLGDIEVAIR